MWVLGYFCAVEAHGSWFSPILVQWVTTQFEKLNLSLSPFYSRGKCFGGDTIDDDLKANGSNSTARSSHDVVTSLVYMPCADQLEHKKSNLLQPLKGLLELLIPFNLSLSPFYSRGKCSVEDTIDDDLKADCSNSTVRSAHDVVISLVYMPCTDQLEHKKSNFSKGF
ncbi:hypothetical protein RHGRI_020423 [Rhododendron griersonianum]|uniref:Uncharacterized protein n=1 Tax=Rhododendron griersonianum TaxID=479676 RepID=A0AAV6JG49_9ERIC|nr:hypothetical protein RHGRI_020423 [Rhododendron griersonianum]